MSGLRLAAPRRLLVRLPNPLGDVVMAVPALRALRAALPRTHITWVGGPAAQTVLAGLPFRDGVLPAGVRGVLRSVGADAALLLPNSFSSAWAVLTAGIPLRVGSDLHARGTLLSDVVALPRASDGGLLPRSMVEHYLALVEPFGARPDGAGPELRTEAFDQERAAYRLRDVPRDVALVGVNPGAAFGATKIYPPARIAAALERVRAERPIFPLVLCGPGEEALAAEVCAALTGPHLGVQNAVPDLGELKALLARLSLLATTDTGPRHMAEALAVPTVVWMGPTDPRWSGHSQATIVRKEDLDCLGCHEKTCPIGLPCMEALEPEAVAQAILARLP